MINYILPSKVIKISQHHISFTKNNDTGSINIRKHFKILRKNLEDLRIYFHSHSLENMMKCFIDFVVLLQMQMIVAVSKNICGR